jgi:hypothetical protein
VVVSGCKAPPGTERGDARRRILLALVAAFAVACSGTDTTTPTSTSTASSTTSSTTSVPAATFVVQTFFLDEDAFNVGRPPFVTPVERTVTASAPEEGALAQLFAGPTPAERAGGLRFVASGATGFTAFRIVDGTAHVQLVGGCSSGGSTFTVADQITATLRQFTSVQDVKIYDPSGGTESPDEPGDSIPFCLEP